MQQSSRLIRILLVENNLADAQFFVEALESLSSLIKVHHVSDGRLAMDVINQTGEHTDAPRPDLILLELDVPFISSRELLHYLKESNEFKPIPVIILTSSNSEQDKRECYEIGANAYIIKPSDRNKFRRMISIIEQFWLRTVRLPGLQETRSY